MLDTVTNNDATNQPTSLPSQPTEHPLYETVEALIQQGKWSAVQAPLRELLDLYPNDPYLQHLSTSAFARSALLESDQDVIITPTRRPILSRSLKLIVPALILVVLLGLIAGGYLAVQAWILPGVQNQRQEAQIRQLREEAQTALANGDYNRSILAYNELLQVLPDDPQAQEGLEQANQLRAIASLYGEAVVEMEAHHWGEALSLLQQIEAEQPSYRDVAARIQFVQEQQTLLKRFNQAEAAFNEGNYEFAIQEYEALQAAGYNFQREKIRDQLFLSYLQLGLATEAEAGGNTQQLQAALDKFEKAFNLRPNDPQARGESQLIRLYLAGLREFRSENWSEAISNFSLVYETRPDFAAGSLSQLLHDAYVARGDELLAKGQAEQALVQYKEARLITGVDTSGLDQKITQAQEALATPTPEPTPVVSTASPAVARSAPASGSASVRAPAPTPQPLPYQLKAMSIRNNCDGYGYIHGVVWSVYNLPMPGVVVQAFNTTSGSGPFVANPTNEDGIYQIILNKDQIDGLWAVQVLDENGQPASDTWGQRLGGGCLNGAQELKVDWQYTRQE